MTATFDCACGEQLEVVVVIDSPTRRCHHGGNDPRCFCEDAVWHAVAPVTCTPPDGCGRVWSLDELDENEALNESVLNAEQNERQEILR